LPFLTFDLYPQVLDVLERLQANQRIAAGVTKASFLAPKSG